MKHKRYGYTATGISCLLAAAIMGALGTSAAAQEVYTAVPGEASMQLFPYDVGVSDRIMAGENGECLYERDLSSFGFVVVASKGLRPEDFVFSDPEEPECRYVDMWYSYVSSLNQNGGESTEYVDDVSRTIRERYGQTPYLYYVRCDVGTSERRAASMARAFVADNAGAVDAIVVGQRAAGTCVWDGAFRVGYKKDKDSGPLPYYLDCEDEIKATLDWDQTAWLAQYRRIREQHPDDTPEQLCQRLAGAGLRSPWDVTAGACRAAQAYTEAHAEDVSVIARIDYENLRYVLEETESARSIGDTNKDGAVDASDAAQILTISALAGTSGAKLSEELRYFYDVNADGEINASDAALILQYAAASGTTFRGTMSDYMQVR